MQAFLSYSIAEPEQYVLTLLANKLRERGFTLTASYKDSLDSLGELQIGNSTLFIGIIAREGKKLKKVNQEKAMIDAVLKIDANNETAMWYLALLYEERNNIDAAKEIWGKIALSERDKPDASQFPEHSLWRISAKEKLMKYVEQ